MRAAQPAPYQAFEDEVAFLEAHVGHMGGGGNAYVLGDALHGLRWHIYVAAERSADGGWPAAYGNAAADHSIEVCMTELCPVKVALSVLECWGIQSPAATTRCLWEL